MYCCADLWLQRLALLILGHCASPILVSPICARMNLGWFKKDARFTFRHHDTCQQLVTTTSKFIQTRTLKNSNCAVSVEELTILFPQVAHGTEQIAGKGFFLLVGVEPQPTILHCDTCKLAKYAYYSHFPSLSSSIVHSCILRLHAEQKLSVQAS